MLLSGAGAVEAAARAIHAMSARSHGPFVELDCTGWTDTQLEHELFGRAAGGVRQSSAGCCERARGGTLFLEGIHTLPWSAQTKLLRLLEHREFVPVGASAPMPADLRVIAGTRHRLEAAVTLEQHRTVTDVMGAQPGVLLERSERQALQAPIEGRLHPFSRGPQPRVCEVRRKGHGQARMVTDCRTNLPPGA